MQVNNNSYSLQILEFDILIIWLVQLVTKSKDLLWDFTRIHIYSLVVDAIRNKRGVVSVRSLSINKNSIWHSQTFPIIKGFSQNLIILYRTDVR